MLQDCLCFYVMETTLQKFSLEYKASNQNFSVSAFLSVLGLCSMEFN
jgi:hypothetical protein